MRKVIALTLVLMLSGCVTVPENTFSVTSAQLEQRQLTTRRFEGISETDILIASSNVLQDLGFNLENSESKVGLLTARKDRDATNAGEVAVAVFVALLGGGSMAISKDQTIRVSLVVRPELYEGGVLADDKHLVRVTFQRVIRRTDGSAIAQTLDDPELYTEFFDKLSKSVFLEAQKV